MSTLSKSHLFLIATVLPWIVMVVSPTTMYLGNRDQYGNFAPLLAAFLGAFLAISAIFLILLRTTKGAPRLFRILCGLLVGLALSSWIQGQLFLWDFGPLDGRGLDWTQFEAHAKLEIAVWLVVTAVIVAAAWFGHRFFDNLPVGVWLLGIASIAIGYTTSPSTGAYDNQPAAANQEESFVFHPARNSIVILLDTYQSDAFLEILEEHPGETDFLAGFDYFPNAIGGYASTRYSVPLILTGESYRNNFPFTPENQINLYSKSLLTYYDSKQYGVAGDFNSAMLASSSAARKFSSSLRELTFYGMTASQRKGLDIGLFRATPIPLKKLIYDENRWYLAKLRQDRSIPPNEHGEDQAIVNALLESATVSSGREGEFKFLHLWAAHYPLTVNEFFQNVDKMPDTRENYVNQARGVLHLTKSILDKFRELGIYEAAEILIIADHGAHNKVPIDLKGDIATSRVPLEHIGPARPLFLYKPADATGALRINDRPVHLSYIPCLLSKGEAFECTDFSASMAGQLVTRHHYRYEWTHDFWFKDFAPPMTLYEIKGDAREIGSWNNAMITFDHEGTHQWNRAYRPGDRIDFSENGSAERYLLTGWSYQEPTHRWTDGPSASLSLTLPTVDHEELVLQVEASGFSPDKSRPQSVRVLVNEIAVAEWEILAWARHMVKIPAAAINEGDMAIRFEIAEPKSPYELSGSSDERKLGIALYALTLSESD